MPDNASEQQRTVVRLSVGFRVTLLIASVFVVAAAYMYWVPLSVPSSQGGPFGCASAASPPTDPFPKAICGGINKEYRYRTWALLASALLVGGGGYLFFGAERRKETRPVDPSKPAATHAKPEDAG